MLTVDVQCSLTRATSYDRILADNGATHTIINEDWAIWVDDFVAFETPGRVIGSTPGQYGAVVGEGYINFFGDRLHVYVANTTSTVLSIGQTTTRPHNMEWRLNGEEATIINHRTMDVWRVQKGSNNLYPLTYALFSTPYVSDETPVEMDIREMPARSPRRIEVLDRTPSPPTTQQSEIFSTSTVLSPNITVRPRFRRIVHSDIAIEIPDP